MRVQKKQIFLTTVSFAALFVLLQLFQVSAQVESEGDKATDKFKNNVVQLSVKFSNGDSENGFGFVVFERDQLLGVVTAKHVIRKDEPDVHTTNIEVRFYSDKGDTEEAKPLQLSAGEVDLALLEVPKPFPSYQWKTDYFSFPQKNSTVWFIGRSQDWWVPADKEAGVVKNPPIYPRSTFRVQINGVLPGTSGAPLVSKEGIIGMIIEDKLIGEAEALDIRAIKNIVTIEWNYPWGLKPKARKKNKKDKGFLERDYGNGIIMVYIPPGEFTMDSEDYLNEPHKVDLSGYWMGKTEVTIDQFMLFCRDTRYVTEAESSGWVSTWEDGWKIREGINYSYPGIKQENNHPVVCVSWNDALEYCKWLSVKKGVNFKLPTEAQWEKAARGTDLRKYPWGNTEPTGAKINFADNQAWLKAKSRVMRADKNIDDGYAYTAPVGSYPDGASPYGLLDMAGNVWEWCSDWYDIKYYNSRPDKNPKGPKIGTRRVVRGGSWGSDAGDLRCYNRTGYNPSYRDVFVGFRLCQDD